jgi:hypothetical protein
MGQLKRGVPCSRQQPVTVSTAPATPPNTTPPHLTHLYAVAAPAALGAGGVDVCLEGGRQFGQVQENVLGLAHHRGGPCGSRHSKQMA